MALQEDPTIQLCLVKNSFNEEKVDIENIKPRSYSSGNVENIELLIETGTHDDNNIMVDSDVYNNLQDLKDQYGNIDKSIIRYINPFEGIGNSIFMSRAGVKMANIDAIYQVSGSFTNLHSLQDDSTLSFCDIAGGPGAFSQYLFWRRPNATGYGITLAETSKDLTWDLKGQRFHPFYGDKGPASENPGNLYHHWKSFRDYVLENNSSGTDIAVADGGFDVEDSKQYRQQEFLSSRLITIEFYLGFMCIREHGNFVCKVFDTVTKFMYDIVYLLSLAFEEIIMFKPMSSRPANAERYLVCINRKKDINIPMQAFEDIIKSFTDKLYVVNALKILPNDYVAWMDEQNKLSLDRQFFYANNAILASRNGEIELSIYNNNKASLLWAIPGPLDKRSKRIKRVIEPTDLLLSINYDREDLYNYSSADSFMKSKDSEIFPWKRLYYEDSDIVEMFQRLRQYQWRSHISYMNSKNSYTIGNLKMRPERLRYKGVQEAIITQPEDYQRYRILSDTFIYIEWSRLQSVIVGFRDSAWNIYNNEKAQIAEKALSGYGKITPHTMRESLYKSAKEATSFNPALLVAIVDMFQVDSMLDFSAGWGDRLIGAMAAGISYVGVDPNQNNIQGYRDIIKFFTQEQELGINPENYKIIMDAIEDADLSGIDNVDLVMTSPPYFDLEIYSKAENQSSSRYKYEDEWLNKFLVPAINKSLSKLNDGGYLVLVINQKNPDENYIGNMINYIKNRKDVEELGVISYGGKRGRNGINNPQPMWIWRKGQPLVFLVEIVPSMESEIFRVVSNPKNMINLSTGSTWTRKKTYNFIDYQSKGNPDYLWRGIQVDGRIEGFIGIHPVKYPSGKDKFFITTVVDVNSRRRGYGRQASEDILKLFFEKRPDVNEIYSDILPTNEPSQRLRLKMGFQQIESTTINNKEYNRYVYQRPTFTYLTAFDVLSDRMYDQRLAGWKKLSLDEALKIGHVDLVVTEGKYAWDKNIYNIKTKLKYRIDARQMTNKVDLHQLLEGTENLTAQTYIVTPEINFNIENTGIWIWRPEGTRSGEGVHVVSNQNELDLVRQSYTGDRALMSRYIDNPLLITDRKFHLRIFFFVFVNSNETATFVSKYGWIGMAAEPFQLADFSNMNIHDTRVWTDNQFYPQNFPHQDMIPSIDDQIVNILKYVTKIVGPTFRKYDETDAGFEIFGCDFMVTDTGQVVLIEINFKPGFGGLTEDNRMWLSDMLANSVIDNIIGPYFLESETNPTDTTFVGKVNLK